MYMYMYVYIYIHMYVYIYIYIHLTRNQQGYIHDSNHMDAARHVKRRRTDGRVQPAEILMFSSCGN